MTTNTCPSWCEITTPHDQDHWRAGTYVPASRSHPWEADMNGATIPAIATHLSKARDESSTDIVLHIGGAERDEDFEIRLSIDDTIAHLSRTAAALEALFDGKSRRDIGCNPDDVQRLDQSVRAIVDAYRRPEAQPTEGGTQHGHPLSHVDDERGVQILHPPGGHHTVTVDEAIVEIQTMTASVNSLLANARTVTDDDIDYASVCLRLDLPTMPTYGVVTWTVAHGPHKGEERSMFGAWRQAAPLDSNDPLGRATQLHCAHSGAQVAIRDIADWTRAYVVPFGAVDDVTHAVPLDAQGGQAVTQLVRDATDTSGRFHYHFGARA